MEDATAGSAADKDGHDELDPVQHYFISTEKKTSKQAAELLPSFVSKHRDEEIMARTGCCPAAPTSQLYTQSFSLSLSSSLYTHTLLCTVLCVYYTSVSPPPSSRLKNLLLILVFTSVFEEVQGWQSSRTCSPLEATP
jgi:hypothetical protein